MIQLAKSNTYVQTTISFASFEALKLTADCVRVLVIRPCKDNNFVPTFRRNMLILSEG